MDSFTHLYNVETLNLLDPELQFKDAESAIKSKLNKLLCKLKKWKVQAVLVLDYKKRNDRKIFYLCTNLIASDSDTDKAFITMHQSIMIKIENYVCKDWIVLDVIVKYSIKIF